MKIICEKEKLIKGINSVIRGVPTRTTLPILEGILIQTNKNEIKLTTYDLELGIEYILEANVEEEGSIVVNSIMFSEIIRKLPNSDIKITVNNQNLLIQLASCQFILVREDISHTFVVKSKLKNAANSSKDSDATI